MRSLFKNPFNSPMRSPTAEEEYAFKLHLTPGALPYDETTNVPASCSISGVRYGLVKGVVSSFVSNMPPVEDKGLRGCPAFTQYFLNNQTPVTQSITLVAGSYCLWIEGTGSATFNGLTATAGSPKVFTLGSGFTGNCTISGTVTKVMLNSGLFPAPFTPTAGTTVSVVSEAATSTTGTSFDLDLATLSRLKAGLRGPNAQGHIELEFESNVDSGWLPNDSFINILSFNNSNYASGALALRKTAGGPTYWYFIDPVPNNATIATSISPGQTIKFILDYGTYTDGTKKMRLTANGVKSSVVAFSGSFGSQDLRFFFGNSVHAGWIKNLSYSEKPVW